VGGAELGREERSPFRIEPEAVKVTEDGSESSGISNES
jgi:hypothetical protein